MSRAVHAAYVEERVDEEGDRYFVATCAETLIQCDAFAFPDIGLSRLAPNAEDEDQAIARALDYLGDNNLHDVNLGRSCDADHVHAAEIDAVPVNPDGHVSYRLTVQDDITPLLEVVTGAERARIRKAQAIWLRVLAGLNHGEVECAADDGLAGCTPRRHAEDCPKAMFADALRGLRAATKPERSNG